MEGRTRTGGGKASNQWPAWARLSPESGRGQAAGTPRRSGGRRTTLPSLPLRGPKYDSGTVSLRTVPGIWSGFQGRDGLVGRPGSDSRASISRAHARQSPRTSALGFQRGHQRSTREHSWVTRSWQGRRHDRTDTKAAG